MSNHPICISRSLGIDQLDGCSLRYRRWEKEKTKETGALCTRSFAEARRGRNGGGQTKWGRQEIGRGRLRRPSGIRRVTPQVAGISALHSPGGSRSRGCVSFSLGPPAAQHAACYARVLRDRFRFCLRACVVTSSPDRELAAPMFQFPSAAFNAQVACRAC